MEKLIGFNKICFIIAGIIGVIAFFGYFNQKSKIRDNFEEQCIRNAIAEFGRENSEKVCGCLADAFYDADISTEEIGALRARQISPKNFISPKDEKKCLALLKK